MYTRNRGAPNKALQGVMKIDSNRFDQDANFAGCAPGGPLDIG